MRVTGLSVVVVTATLAGFLSVGCSLERHPIVATVSPDAGPSDAGADAMDARLDAALDAPDAPMIDAPMDAPMLDAPIDTGLDAPATDTGVDAPTDTGVDAPTDAGVDAPVDTGVDAPVGCTAGETMCAGATLETCTGGVFVPASSPCAFGCIAAAPAHCGSLSPANVSTSFGGVASVGAVTISAPTRLDTTACSISSLGLTGSRVRDDTDAQTLCLFVVDSLTITAFASGTGGYLSATGDVPLVIVSLGDVTISGVLDASSYTNEPTMAGALNLVGPGAGTGGAAGGDGVHSTTGARFGDGGGGGGGFCGAGGDGEDGTENSAPGLGGAGSVVMLMPLTGGANGGTGSGGMAGGGGAGGGAVQLSVMGTLTIDGFVAASGAGGHGGDTNFFSAATAGGGGGSGGGILLEAATISLGTMARVVAAGGGGASGTCTAGGGTDGSNGGARLDRAPGGPIPGACSSPEVERGGQGAGNTTIAGETPPIATGNNAAGGGGGAGCIHFRTMAGTVPGGGTLNLRAGTSVVMTSTVVAL